MRWFALCLLLAAPSLAHAETALEKAKALVEKKDCDQLLLSFENAKPGADAALDLALARVLAGAAAGPCASDKIVAFSVAKFTLDATTGNQEAQDVLLRLVADDDPRVALESRLFQARQGNGIASRQRACECLKSVAQQWIRNACHVLGLEPVADACVESGRGFEFGADADSLSRLISVADQRLYAPSIAHCVAFAVRDNDRPA